MFGERQTPLWVPVAQYAHTAGRIACSSHATDGGAFPASLKWSPKSVEMYTRLLEPLRLCVSTITVAPLAQRPAKGNPANLPIECQASRPTGERSSLPAPLAVRTTA